VKTKAKATVTKSATIACLRYPAKIAWCAQVTDAPEDRRITVLRNGISQGFKT